MRVSTRPALERLQVIDRAVRRRAWPNARTLARELEVTPRTIQRDIASMRRLHAPLEFDSVRNGYYYTDPSYRLGYFPATEGELVALLVAAQVMDQYRGTPFEQDLRKALAKISEILPATIEVPLDALTGCLSVLPRVQTTYDPEIFRVLVTAVRQSRQLSMVYWTASRNETQKRTFDPYDLVLAPDDDWCLIGHCHLRNDIRLFKVQRVRSAVETGECFCRPAGFRARDYMAESFGTIRGDGDFHVVLRFTRAYAGLIAEKQWHASQVRETPPRNRSRRIRRWNHEIHETHERILRDLLPELEDPLAPRWPGPRADVSKLSNCSYIKCYYISNFRVFRVFRGSLPSGNSVVAFMDTYLVAYDISNPKLLRKVASACEDFGLRRQFSVFVCRLTAADLVRLKSRLYEIIDLDMDQVIFVPLCARCSEQIEALGRPTEPPDARDVVIVS